MGRREATAMGLGRGGPANLEAVAGGGVPARGLTGRWVEVRNDLLFSIFIFNWTDKWAPVHVSTNIIFFTSSALIGGFHLSDSVSIHVQLPISANCKKIPEKSWFFAIET
jgi:hypothetical protein